MVAAQPGHVYLIPVAYYASVGGASRHTVIVVSVCQSLCLGVGGATRHAVVVLCVCVCVCVCYYFFVAYAER